MSLPFACTIGNPSFVWEFRLLTVTPLIMKQINFELDIGLFVLFLFTGSDFRLFRRVLAELSSHYCLYTISPEARTGKLMACGLQQNLIGRWWEMAWGGWRLKGSEKLLIWIIKSRHNIQGTLKFCEHNSSDPITNKTLCHDSYIVGHNSKTCLTPRLPQP